MALSNNASIRANQFKCFKTVIIKKFNFLAKNGKNGLLFELTKTSASNMCKHAEPSQSDIPMICQWADWFIGMSVGRSVS